MDGTQARHALVRRTHESALEVFRRLPAIVRRFVTHTIAPAYTVGSVAVFVEADRVLLVKSRHQRAWSLPGGLLQRGEAPFTALARELTEEVGVTVTEAHLDDRPQVIVDPASRQVTVVFRLSCTAKPKVDGLEVVELGWFAVDDLPHTLVRGTAESLRMHGFLAS